MKSIYYGRKKETYPFAKVILFMLYTGVRTNELLNIKNSDINLINRTVTIRISKTQAGKNRLVPISNRILPIVKDLMSETEYFITNFKNEQMKIDNFSSDNFRKTLNLLGMEHTPHKTRHTFISMLANTDINETLLTKIVGHKSSKVTYNTYTHKELDELIKAIDLLSVGDKL